MDTPEDITADLTPLEQRRAALRALSDDIMEAIKDFPKPQSWLEGDRAMRCLGTADRVTVQLFSKVRAHTSPQRNATPPHSGRATVPVSEPAAPFVYTYDDDGVEDAGETESGKALDAALDDMEALLDALDRGETPAPGKRPQLPAARASAANGRDTSYQDLAQHLSRGRDLLIELAAVPP